PLSMSGIHGVIITRRDPLLLAVYLDQDVEIAETSGTSGQQVSVKQSNWAIQIDPGSTPGDPRDDRMTIDGARQTVESGHVTQTVLTSTVIDSACQRNPTGGGGGTQILDGNAPAGSAETAVLFHKTCDGKVDLVATLGDGIGSSGQSIPIRLK